MPAGMELGSLGKKAGKAEAGVARLDREARWASRLDLQREAHCRKAQMADKEALSADSAERDRLEKR